MAASGLRCSRSVPSDLPVVIFVALHVEQIVDDLEGDAQVASEAGQRFLQPGQPARRSEHQRQQQEQSSAVFASMMSRYCLFGEVVFAAAVYLPHSPSQTMLVALPIVWQANVVPSVLAR